MVYARPAARIRRSKGRTRCGVQVLLVADPLGVGTEPEARLRRIEGRRAGPERHASRVPGQRGAGDRVDRAEAGPRHSAGPCVVDAAVVVHPALVPAGVDRGSGDDHGQQGVTAGEVGPGGSDVEPACRGLEAGRGVAQGSAVRAAGCHDDEVRPVRAEVHPAQVAVERLVVARGDIARGRPVVPDDGRGPRHVDVDDLVPAQPVDLREIADRDQGLAVGRQGEAERAHPRLGAVGAPWSPIVVAGHLIVDERINCSGRESQ